MAGDLIYGLGEGWVFLLIFLLFFGSAEVGLRFGRRAPKDIGEHAYSHVATIEGALLGLLALLLGFAFSMAMSRYDARRSIVVNEANDLQTTYLRSKLLPEPHTEIVAQLLREYVDSRVGFFKAGFNSEKINQNKDLSIALQNQLWEQATLAARENSDEVRTGYFIESLNGLIDDHTSRMTAMENHVPEVILFLLIFVGSMTIAMTGYSSGLNKIRLTIPRLILIVLTTSTLMVIVDLDRPRRGFITVSEKAMVELQVTLQRDAKHTND